MKGPGAGASAPGGADDKRHLRSPAVVGGGGVLDDGVEAGGDEVSELDLDHRLQAHHCSSVGKSDEGPFTHGSIEDSFFTEFIPEPGGSREGAAEFSDIFAEDEDAVIELHLLVQGLVD